MMNLPVQLLMAMEKRIETKGRDPWYVVYSTVILAH